MQMSFTTTTNMSQKNLTKAEQKLNKQFFTSPAPSTKGSTARSRAAPTRFLHPELQPGKSSLLAIASMAATLNFQERKLVEGAIGSSSKVCGFL
jgi:hypothetical protein